MASVDDIPNPNNNNNPNTSSANNNNNNNAQPPFNPAEVVSKQDYDRLLQAHNSFREDTAILKTHYSKLKQKYEQERVHAMEYKLQAEQAIAAKVAQEQEFTTMVTELKEHLRGQAERLSDMQHSMLPAREMEILRISMLEELEKPHRMQMDEMGMEMNRYRDLYIKEHRELDMTRAQYAEEKGRLIQTVEEMKAAHTALIEDLQTKNRNLQALVEDTTLSDKLRQIEIQNSELILRNKMCAEEMEELRASKEASMVDKEQAALLHIKELKEQEGKFLLREKELMADIKKSEELLSELEDCKRQRNTLQKSFNEFESIRLAWEEKYEGKHKDHLKDSIERRIVDSKRIEDDMRTQYGAQIEELHRRNSELEKQMAVKDKEVEFLRAQIESNAARVREDEAKKYRQIEEDCIQLRDEVQQLQRLLGERDSEEDKDKETLRHQVQTGQNSIGLLDSERDRLQHRAEKAEQEANHIRKDFQTRVAEFTELQHEYEILQEKHRTLLDRDHSASMNEEKYIAEIEILKREQSDNRREAEEERRAHMDTLETLRRQIILLQQDNNKSKDGSSKSLIAIKKEKMKYKKMCIEMKRRMKELIREYAQHKKDMSVLQSTRVMELENVEKQLRVVERQRDELKARLTAGVMSTPVIGVDSELVSGGLLDSMSSDEMRMRAELEAIRKSKFNVKPIQIHKSEYCELGLVSQVSVDVLITVLTEKQ